MVSVCESANAAWSPVFGSDSEPALVCGHGAFVPYSLDRLWEDKIGANMREHTHASHDRALHQLAPGESTSMAPRKCVIQSLQLLLAAPRLNLFEQ